MSLRSNDGGIMCTHCMETYVPDDDVVSTSCGHVYHDSCFQEWQRESGNCPECSTAYPRTTPVHLIFEEKRDGDLRHWEVWASLESTIINTSDLQFKLEETERNVAECINVNTDLQELVLESAQTQPAATVINGDQNLEMLQSELQKCEMQLNCMNRQKDYWLQEIARLNQLNAKQQEVIHSLKAGTFVGEAINENETASIALQEQNNVLEQKLMQLNLELESVISENANLTIENMRLKSELLVKPTSSTQAIEIIQNRQESQTITQSGIQPITQSTSQSITQTTSQPTLQPAPQQTEEMATQNNDAETDVAATRLMLYGFTAVQLKLPLKQLILQMAQKMQLMNYTEDDLLNVSIIDAKVEPAAQKVIVQFKDIDKKNAFLNDKRKLSQWPDTKKIFVIEYMQNNVNIGELYHYARTILLSNGYYSVYIVNKQVFAKRHKNSKGVQIHSTRQVDEMRIEKKPRCNHKSNALNDD